MKSFYVAVFFFASFCLNAQGVSCQRLFQEISKEYDYRENQAIFNSSMLTRAIYYEYANSGFVVAYIKRNDYDFSGTPYIFCGISRSRWRSFKNEGLLGSWGKSFHKYIRNHTCNCY